MVDQPLVPEANAVPRIMVLGVGGSGLQAVARITGLYPGLAMVVIDTDAKALAACNVEHKIQIGKALTNGFSAGGDVEMGRQAVEKDSSNIRSLLRRTDLLLVAVGLGGGTGSGALPVIARIAREAQALTLCLVSMPFAFEGKAAKSKAEDALKRLRMHADAVIRIPNDRLVDAQDADRPAEEIFVRSQQVMQNAVVSIGRMLVDNGMYGLDFACLQTMLRNCDGFCHFGSAEAEGERRSVEVVDTLLAHRLLGKGSLLAGAPGAIISLVGGADLRMNEVENVMLRLQDKLPDDAWLNFGVMVDPQFDGRLAVMVLVAEQWKVPLMSGGTNTTVSAASRQRAMQGELAFDPTGRGQFVQVDPTIHNNEDLDVPTYFRRGIKLPR